MENRSERIVMSHPTIDQWHEAVANYDRSIIDRLLHKDCVFYSPIVFKPQKGKRLSKMYLNAAFDMFMAADRFEYVNEVMNENMAVLEFNAEIEGILIDGIDMITWDSHGLITEFKVMVRPMKAIEKIGEKMLERLNKLSTFDKLKLKAGVLIDKAKS